MGRNPKYDTDTQVTFTSKGKEFTGVIRGIKEGPKEPLYMMWLLKALEKIKRILHFHGISITRCINFNLKQ